MIKYVYRIHWVSHNHPPPSYFWMTQNIVKPILVHVLEGCCWAPGQPKKRNVLSVYHQGFFLFATLKAFYILTEAKFTTSFLS